MFEEAERKIAELEACIVEISDAYIDLKQLFYDLQERVDALEWIPPLEEEDPGLWISQNELAQLPYNTPEWQAVLADASRDWGEAALNDNDSQHDVYTLAGALVAARLQDDDLRNKVVAGLQSAMQSKLSRALELSRGLQAYLIAADLINYHELAFEQWVEQVVTAEIQGHEGVGLISTAMHSATNWGNHARAALLLAGLYLDKQEWIDLVVQAHKEFIGEPVESKQLQYKDPISTWHYDVANPNGINPEGAQRNGINISGVIPEDWRRGDYNFTWPPTKESTYPWETIQGLIVVAVVLDRQGILSTNAGNNAIERVVDMLYGFEEAGENYPVYSLPASGDDLWILPLLNEYFGYSFVIEIGKPGKGVGYTYWTHGG